MTAQSRLTASARLMFRAITFAAALLASRELLAVSPAHVIEGSVKDTDRAAKTIVVRTADGVEEAFLFTERTVVRGAKDAGRAIKVAGIAGFDALEKGSTVLVHYTESGGKKVVSGVDYLGKEAGHAARGAVVEADKGAKTLTVETAKGAKETFHLADDAVVDTSKGVVKASEYTAKKGEHVTVHYVDEAGRKVAHLVRRIV